MSKEVRITGVPVSEGIAIGAPFLLTPSLEESLPDFSIADRDVDGEIARYRDALFSSRRDLQRLHTRLAKEGSSDVAQVIEIHIQMLDDPLMTVHIEERIRDMRKNTESVFRSAMKEYERRFSQTRNRFFQQRFVDVQDLSKRILSHLSKNEESFYTEVPVNSIVIAKELIPSYTAAIPTTRAIAFITHAGGGHSHAALIARARGIPFVANIDLRMLEKMKPTCIIVDGGTGEVIANPSPKTIEKYQQLKEHMVLRLAELHKERHLPAETSDGYQVRIMANAGSLQELDQLNDSGALGVGLFRSEYLFFQEKAFFPTEEEQYQVYAELIRKMKGRSLVLRVFDIGGDKNPQLFASQSKETNPVLGCRGIRFLLRRTELFKTQLRAILRASEQGNLRILFPMISDVSELLEAKALLRQVQEELGHKTLPPLGCMVEVPSAVLMCDALVKECDFLSIGTNDLAQYSLGIDRSNPELSDLSYPLHPSILRMIKMLVLVASRYRVQICICGEIASNPLFTSLLVGLGIPEFSCAFRYIPLVKQAIRKHSLVESYKLAEQVLKLNTPQEISAYLSQN